MVRTLSSSEVGNLATLLDDQKVTRASDETYAVSEYLISRDAVDTLTEHDHLRDILSRPARRFRQSLSQFLLARHARVAVSPLPEFRRPLGQFGQRHRAAAHDRASRPRTRSALNKAMLRNAEGFVNRLNNRIFNNSLDHRRLATSRRRRRNSLKSRRGSPRIATPEHPRSQQGGGRRAVAHRRADDEAFEDRERTRADRRRSRRARRRSPALASEVSALRDQIAQERQRLSGQQQFARRPNSPSSTASCSIGRSPPNNWSRRSPNTTRRGRIWRASISICRQSSSPDAPDQAAYPRRLPQYCPRRRRQPGRILDPARALEERA